MNCEGRTVRHDTGRRRLPSIAAVPLLFAWVPLISFAHPMGNFSINHYSRITIHQGSVEIRYLIDKAEIPTFQDIRQFDLRPKADHPSVSRYLDFQQQLLRKGLSLASDGEPIRLALVSRQVKFAEGAGGLSTLKIDLTFSGRLPVGTDIHKLLYLDNNFPERAGWKEVVVLGEGIAILDSSAPGTDRSRELTIYSSDALNSPPQQTSAVVDFRATLVAPQKPPVKPNGIVRKLHRSPEPGTESKLKPAPRPSRGQGAAATVRVPVASQTPNTPRNRFTQLISNQSKLGFWMLLSAALIAASLGALHALEPGHGKTVVAAYLVGSRGTARHAVLLGIVVTAAHTAGVYLLGAATLYASRYIVPEQLYPWLGTISGLSVVGLGVFIFLRHWTGETGEHSHAPGELHSHWFLSVLKQATFKPAAQPARVKTIHRQMSLRELCILGVTGGIVPCPAALVVLLSAFSLHRIGFGLFLITAFSFGLAAVLVAVGLMMVYGKRMLSARLPAGNAALRYLPLLSSTFMMFLGVGITTSAIASTQLWKGFSLGGKLIPFVSVILFGLFLGIRHSTDADHVVAVSTIVSRQKSIASSATIGLLWGLGHTLTIFLVGSAIIVFGVVIPPRLGLSMEFCVALMLILLGVLNLTGVIRWTTERFTPLVGAVRLEADGAPRYSFDQTHQANNSPSRCIERLLARTIGKLGLYQSLRPFVIGLVHGLAGSAAVALLVLSTIKSPLWSTFYLVVFGVGTMLGMMGMTAALSVPLIHGGRKFFHINRHLTTISGLVSTAFGLVLAYQIGFVDGLFSSHVRWIPR